MGFVNEELEGYEWQTIDRKKGIVLHRISSSGPDTDPLWFNLIFEGESVNFKAHRKINQVKKGCHVEWRVLQIDAFDPAMQDKVKLHGLITKAMDARGFTGTPSRRRILSIAVIFSPHA